MTRLLPYLFCLVLACVARAQQPAYVARTWAALEDRDWSPAALRLREAEATRWTYLEGPGFLAAGRSLRQLDQAAREVEAVRAYFSRDLGLPLPDRRAVILLVSDGASWADLVQRTGLRADGEALQSGREIFVLATNTCPPGRVAHELVHFLFRPQAGPGLPLWLDEGVAVRWSGAALRAAADTPVPPAAPGLPAADLPDWDQLLAGTAYPESPGAARAFYRQAEVMAATLAERLGERGLVAFARDLAQRAGDWRAALAARAWSDRDIADWRAEVRSRTLGGKDQP